MDTCNSLPDVARRATSPLNRHTGFEKRLFGSPEATLQLVSTFEHFWGLKCHSFAVAALVSEVAKGALQHWYYTSPFLCFQVTFYLGTSFLLGAIAVFMYAKVNFCFKIFFFAYCWLNNGCDMLTSVPYELWEHTRWLDNGVLYLRFMHHRWNLDFAERWYINILLLFQLLLLKSSTTEWQNPALRCTLTFSS